MTDLGPEQEWEAREDRKRQDDALDPSATPSRPCEEQQARQERDPLRARQHCEAGGNSRPAEPTPLREHERGERERQKERLAVDSAEEERGRYECEVEHRSQRASLVDVIPCQSGEEHCRDGARRRARRGRRRGRSDPRARDRGRRRLPGRAGRTPGCSRASCSRARRSRRNQSLSHRAQTSTRSPRSCRRGRVPRTTRGVEVIVEERDDRPGHEPEGDTGREKEADSRHVGAVAARHGGDHRTRATPRPQAARYPLP